MLNTFALLIPVFLLIVVIEWYLSNKRGDKRYSTGNVMMNMTIGAIDQMGSLVYFALLYFVLEYVYSHFRIIELEASWQQWVLAYIAIDFLSYWYHRWSHRVNILWAGHVTHHSSELFNFSNGFRTSLFQGVNRIAFWAILPVFGFSPAILVITLKVSGLYDFIVHTEYVPRIKFLEKILITPSLHRVHHGKNDIYIDKNYGSTFSIWDKMFGTFQEEVERVQYGIKGSYIDNNPFWAIGHHYHYLWTTMLSTPRWYDKLKILIMPPEWKPADVVIKEPAFLKNKASGNFFLKKFAVFQISCCTVGMITLLAYKDFLSSWEFLIMAFIFVANMANVTMMFKGNLREDFVRRQSFLLLFEAFLIFTTMIVCSNFYLLFMFGFLLVSLGVLVYENKSVRARSTSE